MLDKPLIGTLLWWSELRHLDGESDLYSTLGIMRGFESRTACTKLDFKSICLASMLRAQGVQGRHEEAGRSMRGPFLTGIRHDSSLRWHHLIHVTTWITSEHYAEWMKPDTKDHMWYDLRMSSG